MTELARILTECKDTVFTVSFKKKVSVNELETTLLSIDLSQINTVKQIHKLVVDGEDRVITGHLMGHETESGRSLVYDLDQANAIKQVDHRTINWIIYKNVKYSLGKPTNKDQILPLKPA